MKSRRIFNVQDALEEAREGRLTGADLRRAILICEEFGNKPAADELQLHVVSPSGFAGDAAPADVRKRVAKAMSFLTRGYSMSLQSVVGDALFQEEHENMVMVRDIELYSLCEHHILPFFGRGTSATWPTAV